MDEVGPRRSGNAFPHFLGCLLEVMKGCGNNDPVFLNHKPALLIISRANFNFTGKRLYYGTYGTIYNAAIFTKVVL